MSDRLNRSPLGSGNTTDLPAPAGESALAELAKALGIVAARELFQMSILVLGAPPVIDNFSSRESDA